MQSTASSATQRKLNVQAAKPAFSVVAIHDGFFANVRAMEALEWLEYTLCPDLRVCPMNWSFEKLETQEGRSTSVRAAAAADLLLVSTTGDSPLPEHIRQWFGAIPQQQRDTRPILVALHEEDFEFSSSPGPLCAHLREVADSWRTEFMCNSEFDQRLDRDFATQLLSTKSSNAFLRTKPSAGEFQSPPRYWGING